LREVNVIRTWQLQEAKNKFSRVVDDAAKQGPQIITKHGVEVAIVISYEAYQELVSSRGKLTDFFRESPLAGAELDLARDKSAAREDMTL
jgi:prevent-host-death family protein